MKTLPTLAALCFLAATTQSHACITTETESNDRESRADGPLCSGVEVQGDIDSRRDIDWYYFDMPSAGTINISLSHASNDDFDWDLYRSSGSAVKSAGTSQNPETGSYNGSAGEYYLKVTRYSGTGYYDLNVNFADDDSPSNPACDTYGTRPSKPNNLTSYLTGNNQDVCPDLGTSAGLLLMGGGSDVDAAFSNRVKPKISGGDIVVIRTSGSDGYNDYLKGLTGADSVETLIIDNRTKADSDYVDWVIRSAEFLWISGGDQSDYLNQWAGTKVQAAINHVYQKNGIIGGTSAGNAVQSQHIYDPDGISGAVSDEVVTDYCHNTINFSSNFLSTAIMNNVITDTHFAERDRMGRLGVFVSKLGYSNVGIGVSEATSIYFTEDGNGVVDGSNEVYIVSGDSQTQNIQTQCGAPVIIHDLLRRRLTSGDTYNINTNSSSISPVRFDIDGRNNSFYSPSNPY